MNAMTCIPAALAVLAGALGAQAPSAVVLEGQMLPGGGMVTGVEFVHVDSAGNWIVEATTDLAHSPAAVLRRGGWFSSGPLWMQVGDTVLQPAGASIKAFDSFGSELFGGIVWNARLNGTPGGHADSQALYFESSMWIQTGPIVSPQNDFAAGSRWLSFDDLRASSQDGSVLLRGRADDPTVPGGDESFLAFGSLCGTIGHLCGLERLAQEGWAAPGIPRVIEAIRLEPGAAALAPYSIQVMWSCDLEGPVASDGCIYRYTYPAQHKLMAQEGSPSPVAGRNWGPLDTPGLHMNKWGEWTLRATLDSSDTANDALIVKNGAVFVREGESVPDIAPSTFTGFGRGRALLDADGDVFWFGRWNEHGKPSEGLFRNHRLLVRAGQTLVAGQLLVGLSSGPDDVALTPQGDLLLFKGTLAGGIEGAFALDL